MGGLCGRSRAREGAPGSELDAGVTEPLHRYDNSTLHTASAGAASVAAAGARASVLKTGEWLVAVWGTPRFADPGLASLAERQNTASAVADAFARSGTQAFAGISGDFAIAVANAATGNTVLAADRMGIRPLTYWTNGSTLLFSSTLDSLHGFPEFRPDIDRQAIYDYVYFHMVPAPRTIYVRCQRLLPGTFLSWRNGTAEVGTYWHMRFTEDEARPFADLKTEFRRILRDSVRESARSETTGAFLSGGTDSSTLAGLLGEVTGEPARTYSIGFDAEGYDEMAYARIAARHFKTRHHEYYVTPDDVATAIPAIAAVHDQPFGNASAIPAFYCAKLARDDGIDTLLGGDGGDELFGGNERYAKQYLYSLYSDLPLTLRRSLIEPIVFRVPEMGVIGKAQRYMRNAVLPMPARYENYNLLERLGPENVFTDEFLAGVEQREPASQLARVYDSAQAATLINRMLALDLKFTLADNDLPKVMRSCELAAVDAEFPMLNDAVVSFSAHLAPRLKLKGSKLRYFFKEALRDFLPPEIIAKQKHGFGLPFGAWVRTHRRLRELALESLTGLKRRQIIRPEFIDQLVTDRVADHPAYYGTMVWVLLMLEQWFRAHTGSDAALES
jgi:asparagine synthase (glutamine-hydrolysing)